MKKVFLTLIAALAITALIFSPAYADAKCNEKAADGSSAAQACEETTEGSEGGSGQGETSGNNGLHVGQEAQPGLVDDLVQGIKDMGVGGLGEDKDATNAAIDSFVGGSQPTTVVESPSSPSVDSTAQLPASEVVDPASVQIGWNLPNGRGTAFGHVFWQLCMNTGRGWKEWRPDVDAGKDNLGRLIGILERFGTKVAPEPTEGGCAALP